MTLSRALQDVGRGAPTRKDGGRGRDSHPNGLSLRLNSRAAVS
jgi:hypothetical protein